jgi:bla regulator protein BlaR1
VAAELLSPLQPSVLALGWTLVHAIWQAALIVALYAALRLLLRAPRARVALGHLALLALTLAPLYTFVQRLAAPVGGAGGEADALVVSALAAADAGGIVFEDWLPWLVAGWVGGVALLCLRQLLQWRELRRLCRRAMPLEPEWQQRFTRLREQLGVRVRVGLRQSAEVALPMLVGILRPTILMPAGLMLRQPADRIELILLHELAHLRRLDPLLNLLQTVVETLLFYHPGVHWLSRRLREDRELCCDEIVLSQGADPMRYARILLTLAENQANPAPGLALAASGGVLMHRIERIVALPESPRAAPRALGPAGVMLAVALVGAVLLQGPARWSGSQPLPWGFGLARLSLPTGFAPQVADLAPRIETDGRLPPPPSFDVQPEAMPVAPARVPPLASLAAPAPALWVADLAPAALEPATLVPVPVPVPSAPATAPAAPAAEPFERVAPVYPPDARQRGVEGWVELSYRIDLDGRAYDVGVAGTQPAGEFELAAQAALQRWRFDPALASMTVQRVRFDFRLDAAAADGGASNAPPVARQCARVTGSRLCRPMRSSALRTVVLSGS